MVATPSGGSSDRWIGSCNLAVAGANILVVTSTAETTLRPFRLEDAGCIGSWLHSPGLQLPPGQAGRQWAARMLADPHIGAWVAERDGQRVGFARLDIGPDRIAELTLVVAPGWRHAGLGNQILGLVLAEAVRRGVRRLCAVVDPANLIARKFFANNGFEDASCAAGGAIRMHRPVHRHAAGEPLEIEV